MCGKNVSFPGTLCPYFFDTFTVLHLTLLPFVLYRNLTIIYVSLKKPFPGTFLTVNFFQYQKPWT